MIYLSLLSPVVCVQVLEYIHQQKKQRGVDEALLRLYQPIIWRAFKVCIYTIITTVFKHLIELCNQCKDDP